MPAPDRLPQLLRQRALLQEHLAWIDREIADASAGGVTVPPPAPVVPAPAPVAPKPLPAKPAPSYLASQAAQILQPATPPAALTASTEELPVADEILEQYRVAPDSLKTDVKKGCFLYFFGALALLAVGVTVLYFLFRHGE